MSTKNRAKYAVIFFFIGMVSFLVFIDVTCSFSMLFF